MSPALPSARTAPATLSVEPLAAFSDNYIWLIHAPRDQHKVAVVDPGDAGPVIEAIEHSLLTLSAILLTHHHPDHVGGAGELARRFGAPVIGPDDARIEAITRTVKDGDTVELPELGLAFETLAVPGHTLTHLAFWGHGALFCGDTLFSGGCGRIFEGTARQMTASLARLRSLPAETRVYCGHEYTAANLRFAMTVDPGNAACARYQADVGQQRARGVPSLPSTLKLETQINPFLRCGEAAVRKAAELRAGQPLADEAEVFGVLRAWKDQFR